MVDAQRPPNRAMRTFQRDRRDLYIAMGEGNRSEAVRILERLITHTQLYPERLNIYE